jgi:hypothetical protein
MGLPRTQSVGVGLATVGLVAVIYGQFCPRSTDLAAARDNEPVAVKQEKAARWTSAALVIGMALVTRDTVVTMMGAGAVVVFSLQHRYSIMVDPTTARVVVPTSPASMHNAPVVDVR